MELSCSNIKKILIFSQKKPFLIFPEKEPFTSQPKSPLLLLLSKKKIHPETNSLYFRK